MNKSEVVKMMSVLEVSYPNWVAKMPTEKLLVLVDLWSEFLAEDDAIVTMQAVKSIIQTDTNPYPPNIAQIRAKAYELTHPSELTEMEAWGHVLKALRNSGRSSKDEWAKLPNLVQNVTTPELLFEWSQMDTEQLHTVVSSNFMRSFRARSKYAKANELLSPSTRTFIEGFKEQFKLGMDDRGIKE